MGSTVRRSPSARRVPSRRRGRRLDIGRTALRRLAPGSVWTSGPSARRPSDASALERLRAGDAEHLRSWLLQVGVAFVFAYAAITTMLEPLRFVSYVPAWMSVPGMGHVLRCFACFELALALALLTRRLLRPAALVAAMTLAGITLTNPDQFEILFRNVAIICAALALAASAPPAEIPSRPLPKHLRTARRT